MLRSQGALFAGLVTAQALMRLPLQRLTARISPRSSLSKTRPALPRTFSDVLTWDTFSDGAQQLLLSLDNQIARHRIPSTSCNSPDDPLEPAADESEVRGHVMHLTQSINQIAASIGINAACNGGGSGRSASFTDLVVRQRGEPSDPQRLSAIIWGVGEVKGEWQLSIKRGLHLPDALRSDTDRDSFLLALQQVGPALPAAQNVA